MLPLPRGQRRQGQAEFTGGDIPSDGGVLLLRQVDKRLGLLAAVDRGLPDPRDPRLLAPSQRSLLRQRVYGLCLGDEDLNDHTTVRTEVALQTALERPAPLASAAPLCRLEQRADRQGMGRLDAVLGEQFIACCAPPPTELLLAFEATDDPVQGGQEQRVFHRYYDHYCFLPRYVFCGNQLLVSYFRPSNIDGAQHAWAILALVVNRLRRAWPQVRIMRPAESGVCRWRLLSWGARHGVQSLIGLAKHARVTRLAEPSLAQAAPACAEPAQSPRCFAETEYGAERGDRSRRVLSTAEHTVQGANPRDVVTTLSGDPQYLYARVSCPRGAMDNRSKEQQLDWFADRSRCHRWGPNQFRLLLASLSYVLLAAIRRLGLAGTAGAQAQVGTLRLKLLKIGAVILRNPRRGRFLLSSAYPSQALFRQAGARLAAG